MRVLYLRMEGPKEVAILYWPYSCFLQQQNFLSLKTLTTTWLIQTTYLSSTYKEIMKSAFRNPNARLPESSYMLHTVPLTKMSSSLKLYN